LLSRKVVVRFADLTTPASRERLTWAVRVRWLVIAGFFALAATAWLAGDLGSLRACAVAAAAAAALNSFNHVAVARWWRVGEISVVAVVGDVVLITYVVLHTGGVQSPFVMMYVVQVLASAMLVSFAAAATSAVLCAGSATAVLLLQRLGVAAAAADLSTDATSYPLLWGLFLLYCLGLLAYVGGYLGEQLRRRERDLETANRDLESSAHSLERAHDELDGTRRRLRTAERQLLQSEKMRALGQFVAGVAHELNNPIAIVAANVSYLEERLPGLCATAPQAVESRGELKSLLADCREAAQRAAAIVADLRTFARGEDPGSWGDFDLDERVRRAASLLRRWVGPGVEIRARCGGVGRWAGFAAQLDQVFLNLLANAAQAVGAHGRVEISTRVEDTAPGLEGGPFAVVEVADDGSGIAPENLARLFEPFFTTKPEGEGSGLGLSVSHGIVERHGGAIRVASRPGEGSVFAVYLPRDALPPQAAPRAAELA
jgi:signal transduction histidine kinase